MDDNQQENEVFLTTQETFIRDQAALVGMTVASPQVWRAVSLRMSKELESCPEADRGPFVRAALAEPDIFRCLIPAAAAGATKQPPAPTVKDVLSQKMRERYTTPVSRVAAGTPRDQAGTGEGTRLTGNRTVASELGERLKQRYQGGGR